MSHDSISKIDIIRFVILLAVSNYLNENTATKMLLIRTYSNSGLFITPLNKANLTRLIEIPTLSPIWAEVAKTRLETNTVENWNFRLLDHA